MLWRGMEDESNSVTQIRGLKTRAVPHTDLHWDIYVRSRWPLSACAVQFWHFTISAGAKCQPSVLVLADLASGNDPDFLQSEESAPVVLTELSPETWCETNLLCSLQEFQQSIKMSSFSKSELNILLFVASEFLSTIVQKAELHFIWNQILLSSTNALAELVLIWWINSIF